MDLASCLKIIVYSHACKLTVRPGQGSTVTVTMKNSRVDI
jgi:hypothetical protein